MTVSEQTAPKAAPRAWLVGVTTFVLLALLFSGAVLALPRVFTQFSRLLPDNYRYLAADALRQGDFAAAEDVANRRLATTFYDFEALYLLAEAVAADGRPREAADLMQESLRRARSASGREVGARGFQLFRSYHAMARYLWQNGEYVSSGEMYRAAVDAGAAVDGKMATISSDLPPDAAAAIAELSLKSNQKARFQSALQILRNSGDVHRVTWADVLEARWMESHDRDPKRAVAHLSERAGAAKESQPFLHSAISNIASRHKQLVTTDTMAVAAQDDIRVIAPSQFSLPVGASATTMALHLGRTSEASARIDTGVFRVTTLLLRIRGTDALGISPLVILSSGERELARLYLDGAQPREYALPLWPEGAPKSLPLTIAFTNDAYDPITKSDRNVTVELMGLY